MLCNSGELIPLVSGRIIGGVAYSILYTSFESWVIAEANARGLPRRMLARVFSVATFCNAGSAVVAGIVGHLTVEVFDIPPLLPQGGTHSRFSSAFNAAVLVLFTSSAISASTWSERHGNQDRSASESLLLSWRAIRRSRGLLALGLVNSLYETALYVFVFMWTPALESRSRGLVGHGLVFSIFMLSKMAGSQGFQVLNAHFSLTACLQARAPHPPLRAQERPPKRTATAQPWTPAPFDSRPEHRSLP